MIRRQTARGVPAWVSWGPLVLGTGVAMVGAMVMQRVRSRRLEHRDDGRPPGVVDEWGKESFPASDPPQSW